MGMLGKLALGVAGTGMALAVATVAVGPRMTDWYEGHHREQVNYSTGSAAKASQRTVPAWLPDDASAVRFLRSTTTEDSLLRATVPGGRLPASCTPTERKTGAAHPGPTAKDRPGAARLKAGWFPASPAAEVSGRCGHYSVVLSGDQLFAWQDGASARAAGQGGTAPRR
ncbi:hypothetical protein ACFXKJ_06150 [Kitasatospora indigofera]|uniref:hypothetical protein n=1 Tax=Kitasatospora indigofera TaxID=67307 RepID=UPI0036A280D3